MRVIIQRMGCKPAKMSARDKCKGPQGGSVYDRMCDPSGYTGAHAARFGYSPGSQPSKASPAVVYASNSKPAASGESHVESGREKCKGPYGGSVYDRMCDPSGYTGAHAARFGYAPSGGASVSSPASAAKPAAPAAKPVGAPQGESAREKCKGPTGGSVYDRLTDPSGYTGAHAERFDAAGRGKGLDGRDSIPKGAGYKPTDLQTFVCRK